MTLAASSKHQATRNKEQGTMELSDWTQRSGFIGL